MAEIQSFKQPQQKQKIDPVAWFFGQSIFIKSATFAIAAFLLISPIIFSSTYQTNLEQHASVPSQPFGNTQANIPELSPTQGQFQYDCLLTTTQQCSLHACASSGTTVGVGKCPKTQPYCCVKTAK